MTVIDDARQHPVVDALYREIDAATPITVSFVSGVSWASSTKGGVTKIEAADAKNPAAALYHELLHAQLKNAGYRQHLQIVPTRRRILDIIPLVEALDNELQHHRIFATFSAVGFAAGEFYDDADASAFARIRRDLRKMSPKDPVEAFLLKFLTVIAPGGQASDDDRLKLRNFLLQTAGRTKAVQLVAIEEHFESWAAGATLDPGPTLRAIMMELSDVGGGWLGASEDFPGDGVFTGEAFTISSAEAFIATLR